MEDNSSAGGGSVTPREQGAALMKMGRFPEAAAALKRAVQEEPGDETSWRFLGGALASQGDAAGAIHAFQQAAALAPTSAKNQYNLALAYQATGQLYETRTHLEQALSLDPGYEQARQRLDEMAQRADLMGSGGAAATAASQAPTTPARPSSSASAAYSAPADPDDLAAVGGLDGATIAPSGGTTNIGGAASSSSDTGGLSAVGGMTDFSAANAGSSGGTTNIGGGDSGGLASVGGGGTFSSSSPSSGEGTAVPNLRPAAAAPPSPPAGGTAGAAYAPQPMLGMQYGQGQNTSGMKGEVPVEISGKWNWGAFFISPLWLMNHGMVGFGIGLLVLGFIPYVSILALPIDIYLGIKGNDLGWQNRRFESVEDFRACQGIWARWCLWVFVGAVLLGIAGGVIFAMLGAGSR